MPGLGDYEKKKKGERGFKMGTPSLLKMVSALKQGQQPTYEGTDEYRKEKDIPESEFKARGIKKGHFLERDAAGPIADIDYGMHGEYDDSEHNIHARKTEGTIAEQEERRKARSAPGFRSMDADSYIRGQMLRKKKKK